MDVMNTAATVTNALVQVVQYVAWRLGFSLAEGLAPECDR
jgi:hypothetical protein